MYTIMHELLSQDTPYTSIPFIVLSEKMINRMFLFTHL